MHCIRVCELLYVRSAVYETRTYGAMRGARGEIPYIYSIVCSHSEEFISDEDIDRQLDFNKNLLKSLVDTKFIRIFAPL